MWVDVMPAQDLERARKHAVAVNGVEVALIWHEGTPHAFQLHCIHKQRELVDGVVLNGRLVCAGHQWAFDLETGWCRERERCQPTFPVRVADGRVLIDVDPVDAVVAPTEVS